jgi:acyl carrier protein
LQVKIRGKLLAPIEVENALLNLPGIKEAVVMARAEQSGEARLVAYVVPVHHPGPTSSAMRRALAEHLPHEMIPSAFVTLDTLPLNANNKVDQHALPAPPATRPALETPFVAARTAIEERLVSIWSAALHVDDIGVHDHFFELGGDSLLASQVVAQVSQQFAVPMPLRALLEAPTVAQMAMIMTRQAQA